MPLVVDRYTQARELGEVVAGAPRSGELEVEQRNGHAATEYDIESLHIVTAHERPARRVGQTGPR